MTPSSEQDLAEAIAAANGPLRITGGGTRPIGGAHAGAALSTSAMTGISLYEPGALTVVAAAGTPISEVEAALAAENQRFAFEPMDHRALLGTTGEPTVGGMVSANVSGSRRIAVGACRDHALGVRFVDGSGNIIKNGGRVMKNVTGYDLVKLLCGAHGTLGVLSEVSLKVLPKPETTATLSIHGLPERAAVSAMSAALGSPFEVTGAAHETANGGATHIRIEGFEASVAYRLEKLKDVLGTYGELSEAEDSTQLWADISNVAAFAASDDDIWSISVKPSDAPSVVTTLPAESQTMMDWGGGLIWASVPAGSDVRSALGVAGHATLVRAATQTDTPTFQPQDTTVAALSKGLRARFDPRGILNAGLMG